MALDKAFLRQNRCCKRKKCRKIKIMRLKMRFFACLKPIPSYLLPKNNTFDTLKKYIGGFKGQGTDIYLLKSVCCIKL
jgi:hypothetical protein